MSMMQAVSNVFRNYANFNGRARRSEYWKFYLFNVIASMLLSVIGSIIAVAVDSESVFGAVFLVIMLYMLAVIIPSLALTSRRLHDIGKPGTYMFFFLLPIVGTILVWVWALQDGEPFTNRYGEDPKQRSFSPYGATPDYRTPASHSPSAAKDSGYSAKKICQNCSKEIDNDSVFCTYCGYDTRIKRKTHTETSTTNSYVNRKKCICCGNNISVDTSVCPYCGKSPDEPARRNPKEEVSTYASHSKNSAKSNMSFSVPDDFD